jgi:hypothetical protein
LSVAVIDLKVKQLFCVKSGQETATATQDGGRANGKATIDCNSKQRDARADRERVTAVALERAGSRTTSTTSVQWGKRASK